MSPEALSALAQGGGSRQAPGRRAIARTDAEPAARASRAPDRRVAARGAADVEDLGAAWRIGAARHPCAPRRPPSSPGAEMLSERRGRHRLPLGAQPRHDRRQPGARRSGRRLADRAGGAGRDRNIRGSGGTRSVRGRALDARRLRHRPRRGRDHRIDRRAEALARRGASATTSSAARPASSPKRAPRRSFDPRERSGAHLPRRADARRRCRSPRWRSASRATAQPPLAAASAEAVTQAVGDLDAIERRMAAAVVTRALQQVFAP